MPLEALLIPENLTDSDCDGIGGGTGCNFIFSISLTLIVFMYLVDLRLVFDSHFAYKFTEL